MIKLYIILGILIVLVFILRIRLKKEKRGCGTFCPPTKKSSHEKPKTRKEGLEEIRKKIEKIKKEEKK